MVNSYIQQMLNQVKQNKLKHIYIPLVVTLKMYFLFCLFSLIHTSSIQILQPEFSLHSLSLLFLCVHLDRACALLCDPNNCIQVHRSIRFQVRNCFEISNQEISGRCKLADNKTLEIEGKGVVPYKLQQESVDIIRCQTHSRSQEEPDLYWSVGQHRLCSRVWKEFVEDCEGCQGCCT